MREHVLDRVSYRIAGSKWTLERGQESDAPEGNPGGGDPQYVRIRRNGRTVLRVAAGDMGGTLIAADRVWFPTGFTVFAVRAHTGCSHGQWTRFYAVRGSGLSLMGEIESEVGGPVFRDLNGDGRPEWVFDDYCYFDWYLKPRVFPVYRVEHRKLVLTRSLPNPGRNQLPWMRLRGEDAW